MSNELEKEGLAQLEALGFCNRCGRPFVRQWVALSARGKSFTGYEKICPGCLLELISKPDEKE
jgi:hypothetical protein